MNKRALWLPGGSDGGKHNSEIRPNSRALRGRHSTGACVSKLQRVLARSCWCERWYSQPWPQQRTLCFGKECTLLKPALMSQPSCGPCHYSLILNSPFRVFTWLCKPGHSSCQPRSSQMHFILELFCLGHQERKLPCISILQDKCAKVLLNISVMIYAWWVEKHAVFIPFKTK